MNISKIVKHKPTLPPIQCDHCHKIWYGIFYAGDSHRIVPLEKTLCLNCWSALDSYLYNSPEYQEVDRKEWREARRDNSEWKKDFPHFFEIANQWIEDPKQKPTPREKPIHTSPCEYAQL